MRTRQSGIYDLFYGSAEPAASRGENQLTDDEIYALLFNRSEPVRKAGFLPVDVLGSHFSNENFIILLTLTSYPDAFDRAISFWRGNPPVLSSRAVVHELAEVYALKIDMIVDALSLQYRPEPPWGGEPLTMRQASWLIKHLRGVASALRRLMSKTNMATLRDITVLASNVLIYLLSGRGGEKNFRGNPKGYFALNRFR